MKGIWCSDNKIFCKKISIIIFRTNLMFRIMIRIDQDLISVRLKLVNGSISSGTIILASRYDVLRRLPPGN